MDDRTPKHHQSIISPVGEMPLISSTSMRFHTQKTRSRKYVSLLWNACLWCKKTWDTGLGAVFDSKRHFETTLLFSSLHCHQATLDARGWARRTPPQSEQLARQRNNLNLINVKTFSYNKCFLMVGITAPARLLKVQNDMRHRTGN